MVTSNSRTWEPGKSHLFVFCLGHTICHKIKIYDCPTLFANQVEITCYSESRESSAPCQSTTVLYNQPIVALRSSEETSMLH